MSMKNLMVRGAVGLGAILTLSLPAASLAATPQQIIDKGLSDMTLTTPSLASGEAKVSIVDRDQNARAPKGTAAITLGVKVRKLPRAGQTAPDTDGTIVVKRLEGTGTNAIPTITNPGTIEFRIVNGIGYVRVSEVSDAVRMFLASQGVDANAAVGTWVKADPQELCSALGGGCSASANATMAGISASMGVLKLKPIRVTGTEKRWTAANGDKMVRVRARISPTFFTSLENKEIAKVAKNDKRRSAKIAAIRKQYAAMRTQYAKTTIALNVNLTKSTVDRVEIASVMVEKKQSCSVNAKTKKQVCKPAGTQTTTTLAGLNISGGSVAPVVAPASSVSAVSLLSTVLGALQGVGIK